MRSVSIPIRSLMPESAQALVVMPMPHEMASFEMPRLPQPGPDNDVSGACDVLKTFLTHFDAWLERGGAPPALDLAGLAPDSLRVLNETLGEGEVGAIVDAGAVGPQAAASRRPPPPRGSRKLGTARRFRAKSAFKKRYSPASGANSICLAPAYCCTTTCSRHRFRRC